MELLFLPGAERFLSAAQQKNQRSLSKTERLIERANAVSIFDVLEDYFNISMPREGTSFKSYCPFADEHADGGRLDKGWRTYPATNSSMCFPMHGFMTPVRLIQIKYRERSVTAAERILRNYELLKPKHWKERYAELTLERETQGESVGNPQHAVEALSVALRSDPSYTRRQFDDDVMQAMDIVLERLNDLMGTGEPEKVREWYSQAKSIMLKIIGGKK